MSTETHLVGPAEFCRQTGFVKQTFYICLKRMREVGVATEDQKKIDLNSDWMKAYIIRQRGASPAVSSKPVSEQTDAEIASTVETIDADNADPGLVEHIIRVETANKLIIDNAIKAKRVISRRVVESMIDKIDDALNKMIMDGEASFVPQLIQKVRAGCTEEDAKKFWRKEMTKIISPVKPFLKRIVKQFMDDKK